MSSLREQNYFIKADYISREVPKYFVDDENVVPQIPQLLFQPDVYILTGALAKQLGVSHIIDLGCGQGTKLSYFFDDYQSIGVDFEQNIKICQTKYPDNQWIECNFEDCSRLELSDEVVKDSIIVCSDVIEHLIDPEPLFELLSRLLNLAPCAVISTPDRDRLRGPEDFGPPANPCHVREWNYEEFYSLLKESGFEIPYSGFTASNNVQMDLSTERLFRGTMLFIVCSPAESGKENLRLEKKSSDFSFWEEDEKGLFSEYLVENLTDNTLELRREAFYQRGMQKFVDWKFAEARSLLEPVKEWSGLPLSLRIKLAWCYCWLFELRLMIEAFDKLYIEEYRHKGSYVLWTLFCFMTGEWDRWWKWFRPRVILTWRAILRKGQPEQGNE